MFVTSGTVAAIAKWNHCRSLMKWHRKSAMTYSVLRRKVICVCQCASIRACPLISPLASEPCWWQAVTAMTPICSMSIKLWKRDAGSVCIEQFYNTCTECWLRPAINLADQYSKFFSIRVFDVIYRPTSRWLCGSLQQLLAHLGIIFLPILVSDRSFITNLTSFLMNAFTYRKRPLLPLASFGSTTEIATYRTKRGL